MKDLRAPYALFVFVGLFGALFGAARPAKADASWVSEVTINGPAVAIYGAGLVHPFCLPGTPASKANFLRVFLGETQLQVVAASENWLSNPPDLLQATLPGSSQRLAEGDYALTILCGPGFDSDDSMQFTVFVSYAEQNIATETSRAEAVEASIAANLTSETSRAEGSETKLASNISSEAVRAEGAEGAIGTSLSAETSRAETAELSLQNQSNALTGVSNGLSDQINALRSTVTSQAAAISALQSQLSQLPNAPATSMFVASSPGNDGSLQQQGDIITVAQLNLPAGTYSVLGKLWAQVGTIGNGTSSGVQCSLNIPLFTFDVASAASTAGSAMPLVLHGGIQLNSPNTITLTCKNLDDSVSVIFDGVLSATSISSLTSQ